VSKAPADISALRTFLKRTAVHIGNSVRQLFSRLSASREPNRFNDASCAETTRPRLGEGCCMNVQLAEDLMKDSRLTILLVEDEVLLRMDTADSLRDTGCIVVEAAHAAAALEYLATGAPCDLVVSDVRMPGPMDGIALATHLRANRPDLPVILVSGHASRRETAAANAFLPKPYRQEALVALIRALVDPNRSAEP
jgi:two-component system, response regulator PdtaR